MKLTTTINLLAGLFFLMVITFLASSQRVLGTESVETIDWMSLMPEGWDPYEAYGDLNSGPIDHSGSGPFLDRPPMAPVVDSMDGKRVKLPGYIVPLDFDITQVSEFLFVPYIGACVHVPPPPSNQVVYGEVAEAFEMEGMWDPVWIIGTMKTVEFTSDLADAGYTMAVDKIEPYVFED